MYCVGKKYWIRTVSCRGCGTVQQWREKQSKIMNTWVKTGVTWLEIWAQGKIVSWTFEVWCRFMCVVDWKYAQHSLLQVPLSQLYLSFNVILEHNVQSWSFVYNYLNISIHQFQITTSENKTALRGIGVTSYWRQKMAKILPFKKNLHNI